MLLPVPVGIVAQPFVRQPVGRVLEDLFAPEQAVAGWEFRSCGSGST